MFLPEIVLILVCLASIITLFIHHLTPKTSYCPIKSKKTDRIKHISCLVITGLIFFSISDAYGASTSGYSEYYIPGDEENMLRIFQEIGGAVGNNMHSVISVTAWSDNTIVYYDHWETGGYDFDPDNPGATADEIQVLANKGDSYTFTSSNIPANPRVPADEYYDGMDYIYVAGGAATVCRASWTETAGPNLSLAWEVYPVRPQLTTYILPFGQDLDRNDGLDDFERVFALAQATQDNTVVTVDYDGDGNADNIDPNRDDDCTDQVSSVTLMEGEVFLLDDDCICPTTDSLDTGTVIQGSETLQVQYVIGDEGTTYEIRGMSSFPRGFWDNEYYAPVDSANVGNDPTDVYLHNPHSTPLTIEYETSSVSGNFVVDANDTSSFNAETGSYAPQNSALYLSADDVFWGVSTIDYEGTTHDWGYSLVPAFLLENEHYMGWAPSSYPLNVANADDSGIFIATAQDNTRVYVDMDNDGTADATYDMDRLDTQYVTDADADISDTNVWATGAYTIAYGQNPDTAATGNPALDVGYTTLPGIGFIDLVLTAEITADPVIVPTAAGSQSTYTIVVGSHNFTVNDINIYDYLPTGWQYVSGTTTITLADMSQITGASADPNEYIAYQDTFETQAYNRNMDNLPVGTNWATNWLEEGEASNPAAGRIRIINDGGTGVLRLNRNNRAIARIADLSGYTKVTLSFDYRRVNLEDADDGAVCEVCMDGSGDPVTCNDPGSWTQVVSIPGPTNDATYQPYEVDLNTLLPDVNSATFAIRFSTYGSGSDAGDHVRFDNIRLDTPSLTWPDTQLDNMGENQEITIEFTAETTQVFSTGDITRNYVEATGDRSVGAVTQTFTTSNFAFNSFGDMEVSISSNAADPLYPSDQYTYTVVVTNPASASGSLTGIAIYDPLPNGVTYVDGSSYIDHSTAGPPTTFFYDFESGAQGFTVGATDGTPAMNWELGNPTNRNPLNSGKCGANCFGNGGPEDDHTSGAGVNCWGTDLDDLYSNDINTVPGIFLYSPTYDLSSYVTVELSFWQWLEIEGNPYDYAYLQRNVNGAGWTNIWVYGDVGSEGNRADNGWTEDVHDASAYAAGQGAVQWRWMIQTDNMWQWAGWSVDDVTVTATTTASAGDGPGGDPPNFVSKDDGYVLAPGETLTLTFDVTVNDPLETGIEEITNTAYANSNEIILPISDSVTDIVVNPSTESCEVGGRVWLDEDGDAVEDVGEAGISNVEVTLRDEFGTPIDVDITDTNGNYLFTDVAAGDDYYVEITDNLRGGLVQSAPVGHSDDRTDPFDLSPGDEKLDAVLGYDNAPGTATIGGLIWSDDDADTVRDAGEPGLGGITVELWLDRDDDSAYEPSGDDAPVLTTQTTAADGSYMFTGVTASGTENYFVNVDESQTALTDYTATTVSLYSFIDVDAGDALLNYNMGFQNTGGTAFSIKSRIWRDENNDLEDDGENGISGVTVDLLDASENVIATTTTDVDGYFIFTGVHGDNNDYTIKITDTSGVLDDYYGITPAAIANEKDIIDLSANVDDTVEPDEPSFGYDIAKSIGGNVFNDTNSDGDQDDGEPGISGVAVELWLDMDSDGLFEPAGDDSAQTPSSDTTDGSGGYIFSGLDDGTYFVHIDDTAAPIDAYDTLTTPDDDLAATGHQQEEVISGGNSSLDTDFGYTNSVTWDMSGTIWDDENDDGAGWGSEPGLENVTLELYLDDGDSAYDAGDTLVTSATTDSNGDYSFSAQPPDNYIILVTDDNSVLTGYDPTYEKTEGTTSPFNGWEFMSLGSDISDLHFGYNNPVPLHVIISAFRAYTDDDDVIIEWDTASETGTLGFDLYRKERHKGSRYIKINDQLLPGLLVSREGGTYRYADTTAKSGKIYKYKIIEVEVKGKRRSYGPFIVAVDGKGVDYTYESTSWWRTERRARFKHIKDLKYSRKVRKLSHSAKVRNDSRKAWRKTARSLKKYRKGNKLKIAVQESGLHYISATEIADALKIRLNWAKRLIRANAISLENKGVKTAYMPAHGNDGIYFYGEAVDSIYTDKNIYWLKKRRRGLRMTASEGDVLFPADSNVVYSETIHLEEDIYPVLQINADPQSDYWRWDYVYSGYPGMESKTFTFTADARVDISYPASIAVHLQAAADISSNTDHHVRVSINGTDILEELWDGTEPVTFNAYFDQLILNDGDNTIEVTGILNSGIPYSIFYIDSFDLTYQRYYRARDNALTITAENTNTVTVRGFTGQNVMVFDITEPTRPKIVENLIETEDDGSFSTSFLPAGSGASYLTIEMDSVLEPVSILADTPSKLKRRFNRAEYVVIVPHELKEAARSLVEYRKSCGYRSMLVDLEDIMDEFNYGLSSPEAIRDFLSHAYNRWRIPPAYVVLAGEGTFDYKDVKKYGDNLIPVMIVNTPYGLSTSDNRFADIIGDDRVPEIAVGRLPAATPDELTTMIDKIKNYEDSSGDDWSDRVMMMADDPDEGGNFPADSDDLAEIIPLDYRVDYIYLYEHTVEEARQLVLEGINDGALIVNYLGHGAVNRLAQEGMLMTEDVPSLFNEERLPVITAMTCVAGQFAIPGYDSISEALVLRDNGGAIATWSPTGLTLNTEGKALDEEFFTSLFIDKDSILGDAVLKAITRYSTGKRKKYIIDIFSLLGDPALQMR